MKQAPAVNLSKFISNEKTIFIEGMSWVPSTADQGVPMNAVVAGHDIDQSPIYVGRVYHKGVYLPAKVILSRNVAYISYAGAEIAKQQYEVSSLTD